MNQIFYDAEHEERYYKLINKTRKDTREHKILFYNIAASYSLYFEVENIYDFSQEGINIVNIKHIVDRCSCGESTLLQIALHFFTWKWQTPTLINILDSLDRKGYFLFKNSMDIYKEVIEI